MFYSEEVNLGHFGGTAFRVWWNLTLSKPVCLYPRILYIVINGDKCFFLCTPATGHKVAERMRSWLVLLQGFHLRFVPKMGSAVTHFRFQVSFASPWLQWQYAKEKTNIITNILCCNCADKNKNLVCNCWESPWEFQTLVSLPDLK